MYQYILQTRILYSVGLGFLIFSIVFGWVSFAVPDWLQFYEPNRFKDEATPSADSTLKKFGLWQKCTFSANSNDFVCASWNRDAPSIVFKCKVIYNLYSIF